MEMEIKKSVTGGPSNQIRLLFHLFRLDKGKRFPKKKLRCSRSIFQQRRVITLTRFSCNDDFYRDLKTMKKKILTSQKSFDEKTRTLLGNNERRQTIAFNTITDKRTRYSRYFKVNIRTPRDYFVYTWIPWLCLKHTLSKSRCCFQKCVNCTYEQTTISNTSNASIGNTSIKSVKHPSNPGPKQCTVKHFYQRRKG